MKFASQCIAFDRNLLSGSGNETYGQTQFLYYAFTSYTSCKERMTLTKHASYKKQGLYCYFKFHTVQLFTYHLVL